MRRLSTGTELVDGRSTWRLVAMAVLVFRKPDLGFGEIHIAALD
jgi:hypothetical protein